MTTSTRALSFGAFSTLLLIALMMGGNHVAARVDAAQRRVGRPLVLENATFYAHMPGCTMSEAEFLRSVCATADCGMLLDVNNVYVNSLNHRFDPYRFIDQMPLERVRQIHLAGHTLVGQTVIDTHIGPIVSAVWTLYRYTIAKAGRLIPTLIEWDTDVPQLAVLLDEAARARSAAQRAPHTPVATTGPLATGAAPDRPWQNHTAAPSMELAP